MKKANPRDLALSLLNKSAGSAAFPAALVDDLLRSREDLDQRDRAFLNHLIQGVLRWRLRLDWTLEQVSRLPLKKIDPPVLNILRLALYQIFFMDRVPESAAVNEAVRQAKAIGARSAGGFVNGVLRNVCRGRETLSMPEPWKDPFQYLSIFYSYPLWLVRMWYRDWGPEFAEALLSAGNRLPGLTLRANVLKIDREGLLRHLSEEGLHARPTPFSPVGVSVEDFRGRIDRLSAFREGLFQVQDEAAQLSAFLLDPRPGERVLDVCAGFGGKASHMAESMACRGKIAALDISFGRLLSLRDNAARLDIGNIETVVGDASALGGFIRGKWDRILVDAPCSGLGVISRHPDIKWNRRKEDLQRLARLQASILRESIPLLRAGGRLLYITCTLSKAENEGVVKSILEEQPGIELLDLRKHGPKWCLDLIDEQGFFRTFPHIHHMDGFFGALFEKKAGR